MNMNDISHVLVYNCLCMSFQFLRIFEMAPQYLKNMTKEKDSNMSHMILLMKLKQRHDRTQD